MVYEFSVMVVNAEKISFVKQVYIFYSDEASDG